MLDLIYIVGLFLLFIAIGMPLIVAVGLSSVIFLIFDVGVPIAVLSQKIFAGLDTFALMAIPFFILAGEFMNSGGLTNRIFKFTNTIVGKQRGSLAQVTTIASSFFGAISGSAVAGVSAFGGSLIPAMKEKYGSAFSAGIVAISSVLVPIIPPSITMIMYGVVTGASIKNLFLGGIIPGILYVILMLIYTSFIAKKRNFPVQEEESGTFLHNLKDVTPVLLMPVAVLGGIFFGIFTVTESAAIAAVYSLIVGALVYKGLLKKGEFSSALYRSIKTISVIMFLIGSSKIYSYLVVLKDIPDLLATGILNITTNPYIILLILNVVILIIGMFLESNAAIVIFMPIFYPLIQKVGIDPVHFGVVACFNLGLGLTTPPFGVCLSLAAKIGNVSMLKVFKEIIGYVIIGLIVLFLITYIPFLVLAIPMLTGGM